MVLYSRDMAELDISVATSDDGGRRDRMVKPAENYGEWVFQ